MTNGRDAAYYPYYPDAGAFRVILLRAANVVKVFGRARVLRGVDAAFGGDRPHLVEGANGSGKSTLLGVLSGRVAPTSGRSLLQSGDGVLAEGVTLRGVVGWLGHELGLYPDFGGYENVALHARLRGLDPERTWQELAPRVGVEPLRTKRVREMSRGQRQRLALARALVGSPLAILLDEPSTGLDAASALRLAELVRGLAAAGSIVVAVTHDASFVEATAGRRWWLSDGKLVER